MPQPGNPADPSFRVTVTGGVAEVVLYDAIDPVLGTGAKRIKEELDAAGEVSEIHLRINSEGGNVFDGLAIYNLLKQHPARVIVHVDGTALSAASFVAMAGDEIEVAENSWLMVHNPVIDLAGAGADELRRNADLIDGLREQLIGIYAARTGQDAAAIAALMDAETWITGPSAVLQGFADRVGPSLQVAARFDPKRVSKVPSSFQGVAPMAKDEKKIEAEEKPAAPASASYQDLKAAFPKAGSDFLCAQMDAGATLDQARNSYIASLETSLAAATAQAPCEEEEEPDSAEAKAKKAKASARSSAKPSGVKPLATPPGQPEPVDPAVEWREAIEAKVKAGAPRVRAVATVARERPELREAMIAAANVR